MSTLNPLKTFSTINANNGETIQGVYDLSKSTVYHDTLSADTSTDPFAGKSNKFAESGLIRVVASGAIHIIAGTAAIGSATVSDQYVPADTVMEFIVNSNNPYIRIIGISGATPDTFITEVF